MAGTKVKGHVVADDLALGGNPTTTTQSTGNNTTRIATTAFVQTELAALVDSAPGSLNTLNELAAALGDDANFSTTVTNSIATKLPLAGGTMTGNLVVNAIVDADNFKVNGTQGNDGQVLTSTGSGVAWEDATGGGLATTGGTLTGTVTINGDFGYNSTTVFASMGGRLEFDTDFSNTQRGPNKIVLQEDGTWISGLGISNGSTDLYTGGEFNFMKTTNSNSYSKKVTIDSSGNVGIGEADPDTLLHVKGTGGGGQGTIKIEGESAHLGLTRADGNFRSWIGQFNSSNHGSDTDLNIKTGYVGSSSSTGNIRITADGDTTHAQLYIQGSTGNVGVGTTSPSRQLTVHNSSDHAIIGAVSSTSALAGMVMGDTSDDDRGAVLYNNNGDYMYFQTDTSERMRISSTGRIGVGTDAASLSTFSVGHNGTHNQNRIAIFTDDYNYGCVRIGTSTAEASLGFLRSTTESNTHAAGPNGGNNTWAMGLGVWGANFGIGSHALQTYCVSWDSSGHMLPGANNTYDLGSTAKGWRNVYTNDLHLSNMPSEGEDVEGNAYTREGNEVDGTNGSWTIQEGADDLYLLNRLNGKKYKFKLEEVS